MLVNWYFKQEKRQLHCLTINQALNKTKRQQYKTILRHKAEQDLASPIGLVSAFAAGGLTGLSLQQHHWISTGLSWMPMVINVWQQFEQGD